MDYSAFRFRAVIDWVEIQIQTTKTTNFQTVQKAFNGALCLQKGVNIHAEAQDEKEGGSASCFSVRIQDVERYSDIDRLLTKVGRKLGLFPGFKINKIEVALDAYCDDLATQAANFYRFMTHPVSDNRRMYREARDLPPFGVPDNSNSLRRHLLEGWQIGIGSETDDHYQHIYFKMTDGVEVIGFEHDEKTGKQKAIKRAKPLPPEEWRARIENRFSGAGMPCQTPEECATVRFEKLAQYFHFAKLKDDLEPAQQVLAGALGQIGERRTRNRREGGIRLYSKWIQSDIELNGKVRNALRELSDRWKGTGERRRTKTGTESACGNTGEINGVNSHRHGEKVDNSNNYICNLDNNIQQDVERGTQEPTKQPNEAREEHRSIDPASRDHSDQASSAVESMLQLHAATPSALAELERIVLIMDDGESKPS